MLSKVVLASHTLTTKPSLWLLPLVFVALLIQGVGNCLIAPS